MLFTVVLTFDNELEKVLEKPLKKFFFAVARVKIFFVTRISGNKTISFFGPKTEDIQTAEREQIVRSNVKGGWDYTTDTSKIQFLVENTKYIEKAFIHYTSS